MEKASENWLNRFLHWAGKYVVLPTDSPDVARRKEFIISTVFVLFIYVTIRNVFMFLRWNGHDRLWEVTMAAAGSIYWAANIAYMVYDKRCTMNYALQLCTGAFIITCSNDLFQASGKPGTARKWPYFVLIIDCLLVARFSQRAERSFVVGVIAWIAITGLESTFRFGLYDLPGLPPYKDRFLDQSCEHPPCPAGLLYLFEDINPVIVFILDYLLTRSFAYRLNDEKQRVLASVETSELIANHLANFDLDAAKCCLDERSQDLPVGIKDSLTKLLHNLRLYKPYLPMSCIPGEYQDERDANERLKVQDIHRGSDVDKSDKSGSSAKKNSVKSSLSDKCPSPTREVQVETPLRTLERTTCSLLVANIISFHALSQALPTPTFIDAHSTYITWLLRCTRSFKGLLDVFLGDRVHCSFNTAKRCPTHAVSAARAAKMALRDTPQKEAFQMNIAIGTGQVACGNLGTEVCMRYTHIGALVPVVCSYERLGRQWGVGIICNHMLFECIKHDNEVRLLPKDVVVERTQARELLYEIVSYKEERVENEEWMYQLEKGVGKVWEQYNVALLEMIKSGTAETSILLADDCQRHLLEDMRIEHVSLRA